MPDDYKASALGKDNFVVHPCNTGMKMVTPEAGKYVISYSHQWVEGKCSVCGEPQPLIYLSDAALNKEPF